MTVRFPSVDDRCARCDDVFGRHHQLDDRCPAGLVGWADSRYTPVADPDDALGWPLYPEEIL